MLHLAHGIEERAALEPLGPGQRQSARHEAAGARRDHHDRRLDHRAEIGLEPPPAVGQPGQRRGLLLEVELRLERPDLRHQEVDQLLAGAAWDGGDVVDRLVRIEFGALAADLVEIVHQLALHPEQTGLEHGEQAAGTCADDDHVGPDDVLGHAASG